MFSRRGLLQRTALAAPAIIFASALTRDALGFDHETWTGNHDQAGPPRFVPGHVVFKLKPGVTWTMVNTILRRHHAIKVARYASLVPGTFLVACPPDQEHDLAEELDASGFIEYANPSYPHYPSFTPNDPGYGTAQSGAGWAAGETQFGAHNYSAALDLFNITNVSSSLWPNLVGVDTSGYPGTYSGGVFTPSSTAALADLNFRTGYSGPLDSADVSGSSDHACTMASLVAVTTNNALGLAAVGGGGDFIPTISANTTQFETTLAKLVSLGLLRSGLGGALFYPIRLAGVAMPASTIAAVAAFYAATDIFCYGAAGDSAFAPPPCEGGMADVPMVNGGTGVGAINGFGGTPYARNPVSSFGFAFGGTGSGCTMAAIGGTRSGSENPNQIIHDGTMLAAAVDTSGAATIVAGIHRWLKAAAPQNSAMRIAQILLAPALNYATTGFTAGPTVYAVNMLACVQAAMATRPSMIR